MNTQTQIDSGLLSKMKEESAQIIEQSNNIIVVTHEDYLSAGETLKTIKERKKFVIEQFKEPKAKAHEAHKAITALEKSILDPLNKCEDFCNGKIKTFLIAEEKKKREEQERVLRLQREAEEKARKEAEEKALQNAIKLEAEGKLQESNDVLAQEIVVKNVEIVVPEYKEPEKISGISNVKVYKAEVFNMLEFIRAVAKGDLPLSLLEVNYSELNKLARIHKHDLNIAGVKVVEDISLRKFGF